MPLILQGPPFPSSSPSSGATDVQELSHFFVTPASIHPLSCPLQPEDKLGSALKASRRGAAQSKYQEMAVKCRHGGGAGAKVPEAGGGPAGMEPSAEAPVLMELKL